ncbi:MAG: hypothetical protein HGB35_02565 [Geobacteraceae bacterium]|nr:hypothetical protein [Geobacteraceae bacterium]
MNEHASMTVDSVRDLLESAGASVMARSGRSEHYSAPREFSFEVRGSFPNGLELHIVARQFTYRDPWEATGRVNDLVDATLLKDGGFSPLPKGYPYFQGRDEETGLDAVQLLELIDCVKGVNPKLYELQKLTGDL